MSEGDMTTKLTPIEYRAFIELAFRLGLLIEWTEKAAYDQWKPVSMQYFEWGTRDYRLVPGQVIPGPSGETSIPLGQKALESMCGTLEQVGGPVKTYRDELAESVQCNFSELDLREWAGGRVDDLDIALLSSRNKMIVRKTIATIEAAYRYHVADAILAERDRVK